MNIEGTWHPQFRLVYEEFERNFAERGEVGASACVIVDGEEVLDLLGRRCGSVDRSVVGAGHRGIGLLLH